MAERGDGAISDNSGDSSLVHKALRSEKVWIFLKWQDSDVKNKTHLFALACLRFYRDPNQVSREEYLSSKAELERRSRFISGLEAVAFEAALLTLAEERKQILEDAYIAKTREGIEQS